MTIQVSVATGPGTSALHGIAISGPGAGELIRDLFAMEPPVDRCHANILSASGEVLDDGVCLRWPGESETYLLTTHGSPVIQEQVVQRCIELGAEEGKNGIPLFDGDSPQLGEPLRRQALDLLPQASSPEICAFLLNQASRLGFSGEISRWLDEPPTISAVEDLLVRSKVGLRLISPPRVVLSGLTNAGKSTLFNTLVGEDRSIVTAVEGTTRDLVVAPAQLSGWPLILVDGAGSRQTADEVEMEGLKRLQDELKRADLVLELLLPGHDPVCNQEYDNVLEVYSRCDEWDHEKLAEIDRQRISVSGVTGEGIPALETAILERLYGGCEFPRERTLSFSS